MRTSKKVVAIVGNNDTFHYGVSVATEPCGRSRGAEEGSEQGAPAPRLRGIIWLIRLPLVYSVSRYEERR